MQTRPGERWRSTGTAPYTGEIPVCSVPALCYPARWMSQQDGARMPGDSATHPAFARPTGGSISKRLELLELTMQQHVDAAHSAPARLLASGEIVGHYRLLGQLGRGGMGYIYRALDLQLEREVAIKVALEPIAADSDALLREARALAALNHPNVVTVYEAFVHDNCTYIVMELLRGETLRAHTDRARPALMKALSWACDVLRGLSAAHNAHIVHLDVKPENVFLTRDGPLKLLDFGIARHRRTGLHRQDQIVGTIAYMAPEQLLGDALDFRADLFAFGILLHELVTGTHPFSQSTIAATMHALVSGDFFQHGAAADPEVEAIVRSCMALEPSSRPPSAAQVLIELEQVLRAQTQGATRSQTAAMRPEDGQTTVENAAPLGPTHAPTIRTKRRRLAPLAAVGLLAAAISGYLISGEPNHGLPQAGPPQPGPPQPTPAPAPPEAAPPAAPPASSKYTLALESSPPGAMVRDGDQELGPTPMAITLDGQATQTRVFTLSLAGYAKYTFRQEPTTEDVRFVASMTRAEPPPTPTPVGGKRPRGPTAARTASAASEPPASSPLDIRLNR